VSCITAIIITHREIGLAELSDPPLLSRAVETLCQLIADRACHDGNNRTLALNERGYAQLALELDVISKVFALSNDGGSGAKLRRVLENEISFVDNPQGAGKAGKTLRGNHSKEEANMWNMVARATREALASDGKRHKLYQMKESNISQPRH